MNRNLENVFFHQVTRSLQRLDEQVDIIDSHINHFADAQAIFAEAVTDIYADLSAIMSELRFLSFKIQRASVSDKCKTVLLHNTAALVVNAMDSMEALDSIMDEVISDADETLFAHISDIMEAEEEACCEDCDGCDGCDGYADEECGDTLTVEIPLPAKIAVDGVPVDLGCWDDADAIQVVIGKDSTLTVNGVNLSFPEAVACG